ncbi:SRPBCC domain-containing protein [uncultured Roseibium sp.]|uniref:SRPBCC family protein n=1 Tax=uncultured Roseibium sp. TaxID=1936171 RepID=UPI00261FAB46|nr:SRPBCC domain-containing protein [uncultured Roseibium sp.]
MAVETSFSDNILTITKEFPQPIEAVFDAWIDAAKTTHWWGCANTTRVVSTVEPKVEGAYRHTMSIEGVGDHTIEGTLIDYDPPNKLAYTIPANDFAPEMLVSVSFEQTGKGTRVVLKQSEIGGGLKDVVAAGWTASFERLKAFFEGQRRVA